MTVRLTIGPLLLCTTILGVAGAVHGVQTDRWSPSPHLSRALDRLPHVPQSVGDWNGVDIPLEANDMSRAGIKGWIFRVYKNSRTREEVSVLLVCGRGGPISVHTPDVCYTGAGYRQKADATIQEMEWAEGVKGTFRVARFGKPGIVPTQLEIYWTWSRDGRTWQAPNAPRLSFAREPALYKMYIIRQFVAGSREENANSCREFLQRALPDFNQVLTASE
ncbi:Uncharacterized protein OS=Singulisphaera acidiphila (strain ATCC BAA-1392 / DSM 18658 / VKM B-2454 / MOB10) GN=Sinac_2487 PE=4 SV=1: DUF3485 [Gemmata massiliana]|uniref:Methanolan biosynthesis EpsI domain-containing protein n=1 Tax=Gemmata massiliana TaxID=1210884 RepID=A0A6P2D480_9BACT|nr:Uncharacterized protein OS=Singulisphaera acidiphila (strain ATCC BAA-1392 / DSM 18658 / VKM B-2454 / MOB10) GN=Sinac_2487 PE=4 SV=1: DUF3485 [Gemmata massiliana]